jgi:hypothetical protein
MLRRIVWYPRREQSHKVEERRPVKVEGSQEDDNGKWMEVPSEGKKTLYI